MNPRCPCGKPRSGKSPLHRQSSGSSRHRSLPSRNTVRKRLWQAIIPGPSDGP